jgi:hypothetical protein
MQRINREDWVELIEHLSNGQKVLVKMWDFGTDNDGRQSYGISFRIYPTDEFARKQPAGYYFDSEKRMTYHRTFKDAEDMMNAISNKHLETLSTGEAGIKGLLTIFAMIDEFIASVDCPSVFFYESANEKRRRVFGKMFAKRGWTLGSLTEHPHRYARRCEGYFVKE